MNKNNAQPKNSPAIDDNVFNNLEYLVQSTTTNMEGIDNTSRELMKEAETNEEISYFYNDSQKDREKVRDAYIQNLNGILDHDYETGKIDDQNRKYLKSASMSRLKNPDGRTIEQRFREISDEGSEPSQDRYRNIARDIASKSKETLSGKIGTQERVSRIKELADYAFSTMAKEGGITRIEARSHENKIKLQNHNVNVSIPLNTNLGNGKPTGAIYQLLHSLIAYGRRQDNLRDRNGKRLEKGLSWNGIEVHLGKDYASKHHAGDLMRDSDRFLEENDIPAVKCVYA